MDTNHVLTFVSVVDILLSDFWVVVLFGLLHFGVSHHKWLKAMAVQGHKKKHSLDDHELLAVIHGAKTIGWGVVVVVTSYIIAGLVSYLVPANPFLGEGVQTNIWLANSFNIGVVGLIISGYCLILSAGGRWLVYLAKLIATAAVLLMVAGSVASYL